MEKTLKISGMTCGHCAARVEKALNKIQGVTSKADLLTHTAKVTYENAITDEQFKEALFDSGYEITEIE